MDRFKNYGLWISIAAFIPMFLNAIGISVLPDNYNELVNSLLGILVLAGIVNNPQTENKGYLDDKSENETTEKNETDK
jgi:Small integral membrane protein